MVMQTAPGSISSTSDFCLTSAGLAITETTIGDYEGFKGYDESRAPGFAQRRNALVISTTGSTRSTPTTTVTMRTRG